MSDELVIITVGTSLLNNRGGEARTDELRSLNEAAEALEARPGNAALRRSFLTLLEKLEPADELALRPGSGEKMDRLPQELSYLYLLLARAPASQAKLHVLLVPSDTDEGEACAQVIGQYVRNAIGSRQGWSRISCVRSAQREEVGGLRVSEPDFGDEGVPNLVALIHRAAGERAWDRITINLTGGYKATIPFVTHAGTLLDSPPCVFHYLFEDTREIIELPAYPMGLDFPLWHREAALLEAARRWPEFYRDALDPRLHAVLAAGGNPPEGTLARVMEQRYVRQRDADPLQGYSERVIAQFVKDKELRSRLMALLPTVGPVLWAGDKLPIAASHSERHHHNLLEFAQLLLTPLRGASDKDWLNDREYFVLLAALMLHDCGHSLDALPLDGDEAKLVPLFRSEIRKYHHFLAYRRLTEKSMAAAINWDPEAPLAREVAWLCFHHRRSTGWDAGGIPAPCPYWWPCPSRYAPLACTEHLEGDIDFPKLVALLRIIDGCDNQSRRVGPPVQWELLQHTIDVDAQTCLQRARFLIPGAQAAARCMDPDAAQFVKRAEAWLNGASDKPAIPWEVCQCTIRALVLTGKSEAVPWLEFARQVDERDMRHNQYAHFLKHEGVRSVALHPVSLEGDGIRLELVLVPDETLCTEGGDLLLIDDEATARERCAGALGDHKTVRAWVQAEIGNELAPDAIHYLGERLERHLDVCVRWSDVLPA